MVNGQLYSETGYPPDFVFYSGDFNVIGEIEEEVGGGFAYQLVEDFLNW